LHGHRVTFHPQGPAPFRPDPKRIAARAVAKRDDGEQLATLSAAWQTFGCSVCGTVARRDADSGWRIELHHTTNRSQGGHDSPLLGLCGELLDNKCHWRVTTGRLTLSQEAVGWVWLDTRTGETGLCRVLSMDLAVETGLDRALTAPTPELKARVWRRREIPPERTTAIARELSIDVRDLTSGGRGGAERRFNVARELNHRAQRAWMALAVVIQKAFQMGDPSLLGFSTQEEWADAIGVDVATMSKLRMIGLQFAGAWESLPEVDKQGLSMDGLYLAARMVKLGYWTEQEALSEAVAQPVHKLWRTLRETIETGESPHTVESHQCPDCGHWHAALKGTQPEWLKKTRPPVE
jgi:hypothetical protein